MMVRKVMLIKIFVDQFTVVAIEFPIPRKAVG
jgi:hypothetical protein